MTGGPAIRLEGVTKRYRQYRDQGMLMQRLLHPWSSREFHDIVALDDVDLTVDDGETLGVIGRNGSGKTTLLRLLSGVSAPTSGRVRVWGRVAPLIGVGVGFNQELTGRENIRVNGRLLGMSDEEVEARYPDIVAFSEIEDFIDVPVKFYSSGMFLRLAFSVAIHTDPEIMVVDEILAVGDVGFQAKCFDRLREIQQSGTTVVVVTHNLQVLQRLTTRTAVLELGSVRFDGDTDDALEIYHGILQREGRAAGGAQGFVPHELGTSTTRPTATVSVEILDDDGTPTVRVPADRPMRVRVRAEFDEEVEDPIVGMAIERPGTGLLFATGNDPGSYHAVHGPGCPLEAIFTLRAVPLLPETFAVRAVVRSPRSDVALGSSGAVLFHVVSDSPGAGAVDFRPEMSIAGREVPVVRPRLGGSAD